MKRSLMRRPAGWLLEIKLAIKDAREIEQFSPLTDERITDATLFHLATCSVSSSGAGSW